VSGTPGAPDRDERVHAMMTDPERVKPDFIADPSMDKLVSVVMRLAMEISVLRERLDAHEALAERHGGYSSDDVDAYAPDPDRQAKRAAWRKALVEKIVHDLT